jgi:hypothetical protein
MSQRAKDWLTLLLTLTWLTLLLTLSSMTLLLPIDLFGFALT